MTGPLIARPDAAIFEPPITMVMKYDPTLIGADLAEEDLVMAYFDEETGEWVPLRKASHGGRCPPHQEAQY